MRAIEFCRDVWGRAHPVQDRALGANLIGQLEAFGGQHWWTIVLRSGGEYHAQPREGSPAPNAARRDFAKRLVRRLNLEARYDGAWVVAWYDWHEATDYQRFAMLWKDMDGDLQVVVDNEDLWRVVQETPLEHWLGDAHTAVRKWMVAILENINVKPWQMHKRALGEPVPLVVDGQFR